MSIPHRAFEYALVDVFARVALQGNMLAIFTNANGLTSERMQALARETNLAETTFILPRDPAIEAEHGVKVRIFTVQEELQFAGHPTLGTASWLHMNHPVLCGQDTVTLDLPVGPISVRFQRTAVREGEPPPVRIAGEIGVFGTMQQNAPTFGAIHPPAEIAAALNLSIDDLDLTLPIQTVSTGMAFCIVPLRSLEVSARLNIPQHSAQAYLDKSDAKFFYCIAPLAPGTGFFTESQWHNRMQFYNGEDPGTGSASGCAIAYLVHHNRVASGQRILFEQGIEIHRPSRIYVQASYSAPDYENSTDNLSAPSFPDLVFVGGRTIPVASGRFFLM